MIEVQAVVFDWVLDILLEMRYTTLRHARLIPRGLTTFL
jgi:hypothetical protein